MDFDIPSDGASLLDADKSELERWMDAAFGIREQVFGRDLLCYSPTAYPHNIPDHKQSSPHVFSSISVTGTSCALGCEHCKGRLLKGMMTAKTPESLLERSRKLKSLGARGVLISGGANAKGHVPLIDFGDSIRAAKEELGLAVVVHTGLIDRETASVLKEANIDAAMLDIIGDEETANKVYHLKNGPARMEESLEILNEAGIPTVPHVLTGLNYGELTGEIEALHIISRNTPAAIVIIALIPARGTPMAKANAPTPEAIGRIIAIARLGMPKVPVLLGCARPIGQHKIQTDKYAIKSGANGIAYISQEGVDFARTKTLRPVFFDECCSLAFAII
ncbi:MAG: radical SAM protein [Candidatus Thorarchaeota archaeon]|nr:radical SAM protein [Candidatus Thorarchaeota archaeon]